MTSSILQDAAAGKAIIQPWTVEQYHWAIKNRFLPEDAAFELLDGFIVRKNRAKAGEDPTTVGDRHRIVVTRLVQFAPQFASLDCFLQSQQPIAIPPINEPEPDIAIVRGSIDDYRDGPPTPKDVISIIEVSDSSLDRDLDAKLRQYATAGIPQYIVIDLVSNVALVHEHPSSGGYPAPLTLRSGDTLQIRTAQGRPVIVPVERLLP